MRRLAWRGLFAAMLANVGCDDVEPQQPEVVLLGSLGRATFTYECAGPGDAQCDVDADLAPLREDSPFPLIAVGSRFELSAESTGIGPLDLGSASGAFLSLDADGRTMTAERPGVVSVVALQGGSPLDFADVELVEAANLKILQATPEGSFEGAEVDIGNGEVSAEVDVEFTFKFRAVMTDADGTILAGDVDCAWTSSDPSVAEITTDPEENIVTVVSGQAGSAVITVEYGEFSGTVTIEVGS